MRSPHTSIAKEKLCRVPSQENFGNDLRMPTYDNLAVQKLCIHFNDNSFRIVITDISSRMLKGLSMNVVQCPVW